MSAQEPRVLRKCAVAGCQAHKEEGKKSSAEFKDGSVATLLKTSDAAEFFVEALLRIDVCARSILMFYAAVKALTLPSLNANCVSFNPPPRVPLTHLLSKMSAAWLGF